jgi:hypothetical protein
MPKTVDLSCSSLFGSGGLTGMIILSAIVSVSLIPFFALRSLRRLIGGPELYTLLFVRGRKDVTIKVRIRPQSDGKSAAENNLRARG